MTATEPDSPLALEVIATAAKPTGTRRVGRGLRLFARRAPMSAFWGCIAALIIIVTVAAPALVPYNPLKSDFRAMTKPPTTTAGTVSSPKPDEWWTDPKR